EGTILTVVREVAPRVASELAHTPAPRLSPDAPPDVQDTAIAAILEPAVTAGEASVKRTPELLSVLRDAGVVDAGGYAATLIFAGVVAALRGEAPPELEHHAPARVTHPEHASTTFRYCTNFVVEGAGLEPHEFVAPLEALGDSVLVVGDPHTLKVHVHTDDPAAATGVFAGAGEVSRLDVADMRDQVSGRAERLAEPHARCGALAVAAGEGMRGLFESLGVRVLDGGPTLNPSTHELLAGIHAVPAEEVVVLPNSPNVIMAAERAAELSDKVVRVVPTRSPQAGLTAAVALSADRRAAAKTAASRATGGCSQLSRARAGSAGGADRGAPRRRGRRSPRRPRGRGGRPRPGGRARRGGTGRRRARACRRRGGPRSPAARVRRRRRRRASRPTPARRARGPPGRGRAPRASRPAAGRAPRARPRAPATRAAGGTARRDDRGAPTARPRGRRRPRARAPGRAPARGWGARRPRRRARRAPPSRDRRGGAGGGGGRACASCR